MKKGRKREGTKEERKEERKVTGKGTKKQGKEVVYVSVRLKKIFTTTIVSELSQFDEALYEAPGIRIHIAEMT